MHPARTARASIAALLLVTVIACGSEVDPTPGANPAPAAAPSDAPVLPEGWRWEGFDGVLVGVPGEWGWGNSSQRLLQWCVDGGSREPIVGRPGPSTLVGCPTGDPDPSTLVRRTGTVVELAPTVAGRPAGADGDQEVLVLGDVTVRVNAPADLRRRILATVHRADVDANGCPMRHPSTLRASDRPEPGVDVATLAGVTEVAACRYVIASGSDEVGGLFSSLRLEGAAAAEAVEAIASAPPGGGPDRPGTCLPDHAHGDELIVAYVESDQGRSAVHVHFSGCNHHGFDDGVSLRALTRDALQPLIADANAPSSWSSGLSPIVAPPG